MENRHKCSFLRCSFVADEMGKLDNNHMYCPHHNDGTMIHFNAKMPGLWMGTCPSCDFRMAWMPRKDEVLYGMNDPRGRFHFVPILEAWKLPGYGWKSTSKLG